MKPKDTYGKENGKGKVVEGDDVVEFSDNSKELENIVDHIEPVMDPEEIKTLDVARMAAMYDDMKKNYEETRQYFAPLLNKNAKDILYSYKNIDAKLLAEAADKFLYSAIPYYKSLYAIKERSEKIKAINVTFEGMQRDNQTTRDYQMPGSIRKSVIKHVNQMFTEIYNTISIYEPSVSEVPKLKEAKDDLEEMILDLSSTTGLNASIILAKNILLNVDNIYDDMKNRICDQKELYQSIIIVQKLRKESQDTKFLDYQISRAYSGSKELYLNSICKHDEVPQNTAATVNTTTQTRKQIKILQRLKGNK